ncbi:MAG: hypothetical protein IT448_08965 [Phycisphaerales bacterium]|nr:hypothetical protein [Phycisphaerales bacterium]
MVRNLAKLIFLACLVVAGSVGIYYYQTRSAAERKIAALAQQNQELEQLVHRLASQRRIAQVLVTEQNRDADGVLHTTLLFVEETRDGRPLSPQRITVLGDHIYIDALVIKFEDEYIKSNDALRGQSIALFDKIFGSAQKPEQATHIDAPGRIPEIYRGTDARVSNFEQSLWRGFWDLAQDPKLAASQGVRVARGQSVYGPLTPDQLYTLTIRPDGNIDMTVAPVPAVFRQAMKEAAQPH